jgi:hypothetical protein
MALVVLRGGSRDGESTTVDDEIERLLAASDAPGMVDVYEATDEVAHVRGNDEAALVFNFTGQEPIGDLAPEMLHMPPRHSA